jgi:hypothetical protein
MSRTLLMNVCLLLCCADVWSQTPDPLKYEVAGEFSTLNRSDFSGARTEIGVGGRFTYNLNRSFALESSGYFFPRRCFACDQNGRITEVVGGLKVGKRFKSWGIFGKARPGVMSFSEGQFDVVLTQPGSAFPYEFQTNRLTNFATDLGGVLEFYPSRRIVTRFDAGDTLVHFKRQTRNGLSYNPLTDTYTLIPFTVPAKTAHNFQFSASVGFRF